MQPQVVVLSLRLARSSRLVLQRLSGIPLGAVGRRSRRAVTTYPVTRSACATASPTTAGVWPDTHDTPENSPFAPEKNDKKRKVLAPLKNASPNTRGCFRGSDSRYWPQRVGWMSGVAALSDDDKMSRGTCDCVRLAPCVWQSLEGAVHRPPDSVGAFAGYAGLFNATAPNIESFLPTTMAINRQWRRA